jgi:hypothetical protein
VRLASFALVMLSATRAYACQGLPTEVLDPDPEASDFLGRGVRRSPRGVRVVCLKSDRFPRPDEALVAILEPQAPDDPD